MYFRVRLCGMLRLIRVDNLRSPQCWFSHETAYIFDYYQATSLLFTELYIECEGKCYNLKWTNADISLLVTQPEPWPIWCKLLHLILITYRCLLHDDSTSIDVGDDLKYDLTTFARYSNRNWTFGPRCRPCILKPLFSLYVSRLSPFRKKFPRFLQSLGHEIT